jgi:hypothetical protein
MKKKRLHYCDLAQLPVTPVEQGRVTTRESILEDEAREIAIKNLARVDRPEQRRKAFLFWSAPLTKIARCRDTDAGCFDDLGLAKFSDAELEAMDPQKAKVALSTFNEFLIRLGRREGIALSKNGKLRLGSFAQAQALNGVRITVDALQVMHDRLSSLDCYDADEMTFDPEIIVKDEGTPGDEPAAPKGITDIENLNLESDSQRKQAQQIVDKHYFSEEVRPIFYEFISFMQRTYGVTVTIPDQKFICELMVRNNWAMHDRRSWDKARRVMASQEPRWANALSEDEQLARSLEGMHIGGMGFHDKQKLMQQTRRLVGSEAQ